MITNDPFKLRNGEIVRAFSSREEIINQFSPKWEDISIGKLIDDYYGFKMQAWLMVARKK
jgi:hypothetical protein